MLALSKPKLLIVDELGYLPLEPDAAHLFFQLGSRHYETGAMLITRTTALPNGARCKFFQHEFPHERSLLSQWTSCSATR
nr:ATP-binding protein [Bradyrhizobium sp. CCGE-LA001]